MYTLCTADTLRESFYRLDKAGKGDGNNSKSSAPYSYGGTGGVSNSNTAASSQPPPTPLEPWRCVLLKEGDATVIVKEFEILFDPQEKNRRARKGETVKPVSAATAAAISFPSIEGGAGKGDSTATATATATSAEAVADAEDQPWHYRYRLNKRGRVVVETNSAMEAYWQALYGTSSCSNDNGAKSEGKAAITIGEDAPPAPAAATATANAKEGCSQKGMQREIVVFFNSGTSSAAAQPSSDTTTTTTTADMISAVDLNCYHIGYPLDMGDIEDLSVCAIGGDGDGGLEGLGDGEEGNSRAPSSSPAPPKKITTINCPLHNRIFDITTGDMIRLDYSNAFASCVIADETETLLKVTSGKWKNGVVQRDACRQRIHTVSLQQGTGRIVIHDSFFNTASANNNNTATTPSTIAKAFTSDKYNTWGDTSIAVGVKK